MTRAKTVGPTEAGRMLGVTRQRILQMIQKGELDAEVQNGFWQVRVSSLKREKKRRERAASKR